ncbi:hypothetical protein HJ044_04850 [Vibrio parahaemolyticus]|nr:hypothetical protein [Vibrio parahaemolyticus]
MEHYSIKMYRGDTFQSDYFTPYSDSIPDFLSDEEIALGVADGTFSKVNIDDLTITGQARTNRDGLKIFDLNIIKEDERFYFEIPPASTSQLTGGYQTLVYDIQIKQLSGEVTTSIGGTITVIPDVTTENTF